ncbi:hypothetical protein BOTBODRAFT_396011 [Botryobasidium botryosum FD-172 SS1]|uniref:Rab-GAP TBC domain-containing protein n=1 Tax=Botryobasidium botryosum (strain FD-172 SS1) TaxID=930990 RepID=A0A067MML1_BOTB1|nr:hypothetical protein BOTBODRAFT_396011 [Botryobasidium botryosum FD-172 SS1]
MHDGPQRQKALDDVLDARVVDLAHLRRLCAKGILEPSAPARPKVWKLLLGYLPPERDLWDVKLQKERSKYYDLMERFAIELESMAEPTFPPSEHDKLLDMIAKDTERTQPRMPFFRQLSSLIGKSSCINKRGVFAARLGAARRARGNVNFNSQANGAPADTALLLNSPPIAPSNDSYPATSSSITKETHLTALLRVLYIFSLLHPHQPYTQGLNELVAPLYFVLCSDIDDDEAAHAEADTFWMFNELMGEIGEVVGQTGDWSREGARDGMKGAMGALSERLRWADEELWTDLGNPSIRRCRITPSPSLSYRPLPSCITSSLKLISRWIACLLAQDLPFSALLRVWDTIFAQNPSTPSENSRLSFLLDICASMLIRLRARLSLCGAPPSNRASLEREHPQDSEHGEQSDGTMGEAFVQGMTILQIYPIEVVGVSFVIEGAWQLMEKRKSADHAQAARLLQLDSLPNQPSRLASVGQNIRNHIWNGLTNNIDIDDTISLASTDEDEDNDSDVQTDVTTRPAPASAASKLRQYAEAIKASDTAAKVSKVSTNLTAVALQSWTKADVSPGTELHIPASPPRPSPTRSGTLTAWGDWSARAGKLWGGIRSSEPPIRSTKSEGGSPMMINREPLRQFTLDNRSPRISPNPIHERRAGTMFNSPPPLPKHFAPPRDSIDFHGGRLNLEGYGSEPTRPNMASPTGIQSALLSLSSTFSPLSSTHKSPPPPIQKSTGPRPLLLGMSANKRPPLHPSRQSSISSTASSNWYPSARNPRYESDSPSPRITTLRQGRAVPPSSPYSGQLATLSDSEDSSVANSQFLPKRQPSFSRRRVDSPPTQPSSPQPPTPIHIPIEGSRMRSSDKETKATSDASFQLPLQKHPMGDHFVAPTHLSPDSAAEMSPNTSLSDLRERDSGRHTGISRIRSKRSYPQRPATLRLPNEAATTIIAVQRAPSPNLLLNGTREESDGHLTPRLVDDGTTPTISSWDSRRSKSPRVSSRRSRHDSPREEPMVRGIVEEATTAVDNLMMSEEEGVKADDEGDYGIDILSAYEDDHETPLTLRKRGAAF